MRYREPIPDQTSNPDLESSLRIEQRRRKLGTKIVAASGALLSAAILSQASDYYDSQLAEVYDFSIGDGLTVAGPGRMSVGEIESPADDGQLRIMNWNMHNETGQRLDEIKLLLEEQVLDALLLQEVNSSDAAALGGHLPGYNVLFVVGEALPRPNYLEAYGNAIVTASQPYDVNSAKLDGSSLFETATDFITGLPEDILDQLSNDSDQSRPWQNISTSWQENRAALQIRFYTTIGDEMVDISLTNTHLSYMRDSRIQNEQFGQLAEFVDQTGGEADIEVVCGDLNTTDYSKIDQLFDRFNIPETGPTTDYDNQPIDYCMINTDNHPSSTSLKVSLDIEPDYQTDHSALLLEITDS